MITLVTILRNLWLGYKISKSKLFGYSKTFQTAFFKTFYQVTASTNKDIIVEAGYQKDVAVSVNKKSMNKSSSRNVFPRF